ncbi:hypothetical protein PSC71_08275 [Devosia sp. J2-20]|uniref:hypothetical protein n=1 Tax=Devosia sp. J2-20 TaxID=3026161 RepID=UPI00249B730A|nr:hypothetical protein [Devosia sp. J2-20]WDR00729.1 hypothetical protein PSC71_08275 [Devosia sp. J2-20]
MPFPTGTLFDWPERQRIAEITRRRAEIASRIPTLRPRSFKRVQLQGVLHDLTQQELALEAQLARQETVK